MINIFMTLYEIVFRINEIKRISINEIKKILMSENGLRKLFRINKIKQLTGSVLYCYSSKKNKFLLRKKRLLIS
jgi:hypothetical protein